MRRLKTCLRAEGGVTLIELLVAIVVMSIGIAALVAGLSSGILAVDRARLASTAGTLADKQMELYRQAAFTSLPIGLQTPTTPMGADGHTYWMRVGGEWTCAVPGSTYSAGPPASCSVPPGAPASRPLKLLTIEVRDGSSAGKVLITQSATFDSSTS
jgi:prepilin-type N-terminal cleavage/methylation domain-containing protein